ncbi:CotO family spore coat protein [Bacillus pinisoli]|uniref:CotO family spore coat protein n=1 Tax=Bacillus pinisoli TaxID=2901866 RepID=UPI001FF1DBA3|nr:CotO family spore coat protein [Bacillus pinisoli]
MKEAQAVKRSPLLYITQPNLQPAYVKVQEYISIKKEAQIIEEESVTKEKKVVEQQGVAQEGNNAAKSTNDRKSFKEFSTLEKIHFFTNAKSNMPKPLCEIMTEHDTFQGKIMSLENEMVTARILKDPYKVEIPLSSIKSVQIIGL